MQEMKVWSLSWEDPLEEGMATHSSILAGKKEYWRGEREPGGCNPWGYKELDTTEVTEHPHTDGLGGKESTCSAGDTGSISGSGRSPGGANGNPLQYSCLKNPTDKGTWWATIQKVTKSQDWVTKQTHIQGFLNNPLNFWDQQILHY